MCSNAAQPWSYTRRTLSRSTKYSHHFSTPQHFLSYLRLSHICLSVYIISDLSKTMSAEHWPLTPDSSDSTDTSWTAVAQVTLLLRTDDKKNKNKTQQAHKCTKRFTNPVSASNFWWIKVEDGLCGADLQKQTLWFVSEWENLAKCKMSQVSGNPPLPHPTRIPRPHS